MTAPYERIHFILNPAAGSRRRTQEMLSAIFDQHMARWEMSVTAGPGDAKRLAQEAVAAGADLIAVCGGDGTVADVAGGLAGSSVPLAILPGGTANILAVELGIPRTLSEAAELIFRPNCAPRSLDMGQIGDRYFLVRASAGFEAAVIEKTGQPLKNRFGPFGYGVGAIWALRPRLAAHFRLTLDGRVVEAAGLNVFIANAGHIGLLGLVLSPCIRPDDGLLDVILLEAAPRSLVALAASAVRLDKGAGSLRHWQVRGVTVEADPPQSVHGDGDMAGRTPITVGVLPGAVRVLVPG